MKDGQFIHISGWMGKQLGLRGNDLICFAIIYGFSQDGESQFKGNLNYLAECMFASQPTALLCLKHLLECNLILKKEDVINGKKRCYYSTNILYDEGDLEAQDATKKPLVMTTKEPLAVTTKEPLDNNYSNNNKEDNKEKRDNNKLSSLKKDDINFDSFYKLYPLKKGKPCAEQAWKKLSEKDKKEAIEKLPAYIADCVTNKRSFKYPATYLNQRTWEDDFSSKQKVGFYDILETDNDKKKRFKNWMRTNYSEIENTALPLSYEDYMEIIGSGYELVSLVNTILDDIEQNIWKYRKSDIASVIKAKIKEEESDE